MLKKKQEKRVEASKMIRWPLTYMRGGGHTIGKTQTYQTKKVRLWWEHCGFSPQNWLYKNTEKSLDSKLVLLFGKTAQEVCNYIILQFSTRLSNKTLRKKKGKLPKANTFLRTKKCEINDILTDFAQNSGICKWKQDPNLDSVKAHSGLDVLHVLVPENPEAFIVVEEERLAVTHCDQCPEDRRRGEGHRAPDGSNDPNTSGRGGKSQQNNISAPWLLDYIRSK